MSKIVFYDWPYSPFCMKVRAILDYKHLKYECVNPLSARGTLNRRGTGKVPGSIMPEFGSVARQRLIADWHSNRQEISNLVTGLETALTRLSSADPKHGRLAFELMEILHGSAQIYAFASDRDTKPNSAATILGGTIVGGCNEREGRFSDRPYKTRCKGCVYGRRLLP